MIHAAEARRRRRESQTKSLGSAARFAATMPCALASRASRHSVPTLRSVLPRQLTSDAWRTPIDARKLRKDVRSGKSKRREAPAEQDNEAEVEQALQVADAELPDVDGDDDVDANLEEEGEVRLRATILRCTSLIISHLRMQRTWSRKE